MKKNKQLLLILLLGVVFAQFGCQKFLDRKPLATAINGDVAGGGSQTITFSLYSATANLVGYYDPCWQTIHAARADDNINSTAGDGTSQQTFCDQFQYNKNDWLISNNWDRYLGFIIQAANAIHDIDSINGTTPDGIINLAEARCLRAMAYFDVVRDYGEAPIIRNKVYQISDGNLPKTSVSAIYNFIDSDLVYAAQHLPASWSAAFLGRVTSGTANALLAKSYLYQKNWAMALSSANAVINSGLYSLDPSYDHLFTEAGENGSESLFEIQNYENANGSVIQSNYLPTFQGVRGSGAWNLGWGWNLPAQSLVNAYEPNDPRKGTTILTSNQPDNYYGGVTYSVSLPPSPTPYWNKKVYTDPARRAATGDFGGDWLNTILLRYSDVLLIAAEAANETGDGATAAKYLEIVRNRASGNLGKSRTIVPSITFTSQSQMRIAIKKERRVEFGMEYERFYDLVRWEINQGTPGNTSGASAAPDGIDAITVLGLLGYTPKNAYLPIPQTDIDNSNGILKQNPDYP